MPEREPLPPGQLPNIFDTDPPPMHPATVVGDGVVYVDEEKLKAFEAAKAHALERHAAQARHPQQEAHGGRQAAQEGTKHQ